MSKSVLEYYRPESDPFGYDVKTFNNFPVEKIKKQTKPKLLLIPTKIY